ncbi:glycosyltransferase [Flavobacterium sp. FlaQc-30]|uniref:glycosyltransferase n=1 Tax=Flavobacterium sp. FlaQc-30 TaxID=3374179 RepID=UPI003757E55C
MRVVQIVDSLQMGGAERMAVNYANALSKEMTFSGLVVTRKEGQLSDQIDEKVSYLFLNKKSKVDFKAVFRLRKYILKNRIDIVHAHSTSFFTAVLVKLTLPQIKIFWHDHFGNRAAESKSKNKMLIFCSLFFTSIFVVSLQLEAWSKKNMFCKNVFFIPNFILDRKENLETTRLKGILGRRIVFLANLKEPKNHMLMLKAFQDLRLQESGWTLHLIGKDYFDSYSAYLKEFIKFNSLESYIHLYGEKNDIKYILSQSSIGVLTSTNEGFPITLLEYASEKLAVLSSNVGYCSEIIENGFNGLLFDPLNYLELKDQLKLLTYDEALRTTLAENFSKSTVKEYSKEAVIKKVIQLYKN